MVGNPLLGRIQNREAKVGVVGLGYVGLPLGMAFAEAGFPVTGLDVDQRKIDKIGKGESYIKHIPSGPLAELTNAGKLKATNDFAKSRELDCVIICVPTPLTASREPDMTFIIQTGEALAPYVRPGQLFILESTTYPGTTEEILKPLLEKGGLKAGVDFFLAFSPEREDPGNKGFNTKTIPKVVGGYSPACLEVAVALYGSALKEVVPVSSTRVAELSKLLENIYRCVNIAMVNEMKMLCDRMNVDVWEVIQAASTKPFGFQPFYPGPGLGGHCIPIDPFYLTWKAREFEFHTKFIELAGEVNWQMPYYVVQRTMEALNQNKKVLNGAKVLCIGAAYKKDIDDFRESPSLRVMTLLKEKGADISYHDPFVKELHKGHGFNMEMKSVPLDPETLNQYDAVMILTDHSHIDYNELVQRSNIVVDTRNATKAVTQGREKIVKA
ncbi:nucleotide sugar dehydrogenase [Corallococcus carmarthensis]|uniref:Nucleotide sugar dehydrogenase n=1 Tax=Corallococcus carmarthensis TaxID=2316728 RepID=A0A3A8JYI5_9BACT|nr:nucleotide sugar dehydrogenase [Corallococcus carmarthensis]NOK17911.1 nucleotide sugar dehydrogenase [Corallococcus carmarthensis]RKG95411.1 nucleotide sugar dehydrogenase [Corallococcus carmarthensis]